MEHLFIGIVGLGTGIFMSFFFLRLDSHHKRGRLSTHTHIQLIRRAEKFDSLMEQMGGILNDLQKVICITDEMMGKPLAPETLNSFKSLNELTCHVHNVFREHLFLHDNNETINRDSQKSIARMPVKLETPILIVEDDKLLLKSIESMLRKIGYDCQSVETGEKAIDLINSKPYQLILMDYSLPGIDGSQTAKTIRGMNNGKDAIIIALTGHALRGDKEQMIAAGMNAYLSKPFTPSELKILISRFFNLCHSELAQDEAA